MACYSGVMPRQSRIIEKGGIYHVINRGVEKRKIFQKEQDYSRFIIGMEFFNCSEPVNLWEFLARNLKDKNLKNLIALRLQEERNKKKEPMVEILAFCLMPNHYHFILKEIKEGGISKFMKKMGGYSTYFNKQYKRVGPLFQSRFKSIPVKDDRQLQALFNYVHTNPVELLEPGWKDFKVKNFHQATDFLKNYKWSSYLDYIGQPNHPFVTRRSFFSKIFGNFDGCEAAIGDWVKYKAVKLRDDAELASLLMR